MAINSYEELMSLVESRRQDRLTLEIDMGTSYNVEHEKAKEELLQARAIRNLAGDQGFISDNFDELERRVEETRPPANSVWVVFSRLDLKTWSLLVKKINSMQPFDQYEKVLDKTFVGVFSDPEATPDSLISDDYHLVSTQSDKCILSGGMMTEVVKTFMSWQNSGGEVTIRPTK